MGVKNLLTRWIQVPEEYEPVLRKIKGADISFELGNAVPAFKEFKAEISFSIHPFNEKPVNLFEKKIVGAVGPTMPFKAIGSVVNRDGDSEAKARVAMRKIGVAASQFTA